jgi:hypothetical protein
MQTLLAKAAFRLKIFHGRIHVGAFLDEDGGCAPIVEAGFGEAANAVL